jgi:hypothetical protein
LKKYIYKYAHGRFFEKHVKIQKQICCNCHFKRICKILFCTDAGCQGIYVNEDAPNIAQLLFADDMADLADTVVSLKRQISVLSDLCRKYAMKVDLQKTQIMVFRKGGPLRTREE